MNLNDLLMPYQQNQPDPTAPDFLQQNFAPQQSQTSDQLLGVPTDSPFQPAPRRLPSQSVNPLGDIGANLDQRLGDIAGQQPAAPAQPQTSGLTDMLMQSLQGGGGSLGGPLGAGPSSNGAGSSWSAGADNAAADAIANIKGIDPGKGVSNPGQLIKLGKTQVGVPYVFGSENPAGDGGSGAAFDCSGFTKWVYSHYGVELPHQALQQANVTGANLTADQLKPGDPVYFSYGRLGSGVIDHVMIYMGNGKAIGAQPSSNGVGIQPMNWDAFVGGGRVNSPTYKAPAPRTAPQRSAPSPAPQTPRGYAGTSSAPPRRKPTVSVHQT